MKTSQKNIAYTLPPCEYMEFLPQAKWLWLDPVKYPDRILAPCTTFAGGGYTPTAVEFSRTLTLPHGKNPVAHICIFADTKYRLTVNGSILGVGPIAAGGDYGNCQPMPVQYYDCYTLPLGGDTLNILAEVQTPGLVMTDYSCGRGGFLFSCEVTFDDREPVTLVSDGSWRVRLDHRVISLDRQGIHELDFTAPAADWEAPYVLSAAEIPWTLAFADIPLRAEEVIRPIRTESDDACIRAEFDRIYAAYLCINVQAAPDAEYTLRIHSAEYRPDTDREPVEIVHARGNLSYRGFRMRSVGEVAVTVLGAAVVPEISLIYACYPADRENTGDFACSDALLSQIYDVGRFSLEMCRQTLHLDSQLHQETLGCTGDYAIESLMTHMTFGDMRLSRLDLIRTADWLKLSGGFMFHTTYSPIWIHMLRDYYDYTADDALVRELYPVMRLLLARLESYKGGSGTIENPPSFMFVDWGTLDGNSMHHPPMALGQAALNAFYYKGLTDAAYLCGVIGEDAAAYRAEVEALRAAFNRAFYDAALGLYRDGFAASERQNAPAQWLPANIEACYHTRHIQTLAVLYGLIDGETATALMRRVVTEETLDGGTVFDIQPYFMHYVLEAVRKVGLFGEHGLRLLHLWDKQVEESPKGMKEGWGEFHGDCSHAWGATPTYQLPMAFSGFEMLEPGFKKFRLAPSLWGLEGASLAIPTPYGLMKISQHVGEDAVISVPDAFEAVGGGVYRMR